MEQDKQPKRVKNVDAQTHRAGTHRAAIKPHKRSTASTVKSVISSYMGSVKTGTLNEVLAKADEVIRAEYRAML